MKYLVGVIDHCCCVKHGSRGFVCPKLRDRSSQLPSEPSAAAIPRLKMRKRSNGKHGQTGPPACQLLVQLLLSFLGSFSSKASPFAPGVLTYMPLLELPLL